VAIVSARAVIVSAVAAFTAAGQLQPSAVIAQERFSLSSDRVAIYNLAGEVRVERGTGSNVVVEVSRRGDDGDELEIRRVDRDGWQMLVIRSPERSIVYRGRGRWSRTEFGVDRDGTFGLKNLDPALGADRVAAKADGGKREERVRVSGSGRGLEAHAVLRVLIPAGKTVAVHLGVGSIAVNEVAADLQVDTRSGSVSAQRTSGFLRIDSGSGSIEVESIAGDVALNTGSGGVKAHALDKGVLKVHTGSGSVDVTEIHASEMSVSTGSGSVTASGIGAPMLSISTGSGGIRGRKVAASKFDLHTGSGSISLDLLSDVDMGRVRTGSGGVTITTSRVFGADVTLDTGSGGIDVDVPFDLIDRRKSFMHARMGDGHGTLQVNTGSGSIAIR
jgi:hypothetical protein